MKKINSIGKELKEQRWLIENQDLITFGIKPTQPNTGYGYLELANLKDAISKVLKFTKKTIFSSF